MKQIIFLLFIPFVFKAQSLSQNVFELLKDLKKNKLVAIPEYKEPWQKSSVFTLLANQITFVNWQKGGVNTLSFTLKGQFDFDYIQDDWLWLNDINIEYGFIKQEDKDWRKGGDKIDYRTTFNYKSTIDRWFYSAGFTFLTQFSNGYKYTKDKEQLISSLFAPAKMFIGVGTMYSYEGINLSIFPITHKLILVLNQELADRGTEGVKPAIKTSENTIITSGEKLRAELGVMVELEYFKQNLWESISTSQKLRLYTDYLVNFGNIDIYWEGRFDMRINKYFIVHIDLNLIYDNDILIGKDENNDEKIEEIEKKPRVQFKKNIGIGFTYKFI